MTQRHFGIAVALEGTGRHPASWRERGARGGSIFDRGYWLDLAVRAEAAGVDALVLPDALALQSSDAQLDDERFDQLRGRLDAVLLASWLAPRTERIGLLPATSTTFTEPFHIAKAIATLDFISHGRAGWLAAPSYRLAEQRHFGRRTAPGASLAEDDPARLAWREELQQEAAEFIDIVRRLWDSWQDDAEIRDVATDRFLDRDRLHAIDYRSERFAVRGPLITPRPPQGQPIVTVQVRDAGEAAVAAASADIAFLRIESVDGAGEALALLREQEGERLTPEPLRVYADVIVIADGEQETATARLSRLNTVDGSFHPDSAVLLGGPEQLARALASLAAQGFDGVRLHPGTIAHDFDVITGTLLPRLAELGLIEPQRQAVNLRDRLGLAASVPNRYVAVPAASA